MNGTYIAVVDRIIDGETAVLLFEEDDEVIEQIELAVEQLPERGQHEGAVLNVDVAGNNVESIQYEPNATRNRQESLKERLDRLSTPLKDQDKTDN